MKKISVVILLFFILFSSTFLNAQWAKTYGGAGDDEAYSIAQTSDGGYVVAGLTDSFDSKASVILILKLNSEGEVEWQKGYAVSTFPYIGTYTHLATIQQTSDGGYVVAGDTRPASYMSYMWCLKLYPDGHINWGRSVFKNFHDVKSFLTSIQQTNDGGFVMSGYNYNWDPSPNRNLPCNFVVLKMSSTGNLQWSRRYGDYSYEAYEDKAMSIQQTSDRGYIVGGHTNNYGAGGDDYLILKLDSVGDVEWQFTYGGSYDEEFYSIQQTSDGGYIALGWTKSFGAGLTDCWILKLDPEGDIEWQRAYGGERLDGAYSIQQIRGGGYIVVGPTTSFGMGRSDFFMMQLTSEGDIEWYRTCGGVEQDEALSIPQTIDGGFIAAGYSESFGAGGKDFFVTKLNSQGEIHSSCSLIQSANPTVTVTNITPQSTDVDVRDVWGGEGSHGFPTISTSVDTNVICEAPTEYKLYLSTTAGGTTNPLPGTYTYEEGTSVVLSAIPNSGYLFNGWTGDVLFGLENNNPLSLVIDSIKHVRANFILPSYLTIELSIGGTTYPASGVYTYKKGTTVGLWAFPSIHYTFSSWTGNVPSGDENDNPISLTLDSNKTIRPNFLRSIYLPSNFQGQKIFNRSLSQSEYINVLTWQANGDNADIVKYRIYSIGGKLLAEVDSSTLQYMDRKVGKDTYYTYICKAVNNEGREGNSAIVTVW